MWKLYILRFKDFQKNRAPASMMQCGTYILQTFVFSHFDGGIVHVPTLNALHYAESIAEQIDVPATLMWKNTFFWFTRHTGSSSGSPCRDYMGMGRWIWRGVQG